MYKKWRKFTLKILTQYRERKRERDKETDRQRDREQREMGEKRQKEGEKKSETDLYTLRVVQTTANKLMVRETE